MGRAGSKWVAWATTASPELLTEHARALSFAREHHQIAQMLVPLGKQRPGKTFDVIHRKKMHFYTCKNLLDDGRCGVYATRPRMCADYPYGKRCDYAQCTWAAVKSDHPPAQYQYEHEGRVP